MTEGYLCSSLLKRRWDRLDKEDAKLWKEVSNSGASVHRDSVVRQLRFLGCFGGQAQQSEYASPYRKVAWHGCWQAVVVLQSTRVRFGRSASASAISLLLPAPDTLAWMKQHLVVQGCSPAEQSLRSISAADASKGIWILQ